MTIADEIRSLAQQGLSVADIARSLGIRYQHAYGVLKRSEGPPVAPKAPAAAVVKPQLDVAVLLRSGFTVSAAWILEPSGALTLDRPLPKESGVYAFATDDVVQYVGVATMGLAKRIYFYGRPGKTQATSLRVNAVIKNLLTAGTRIEVYTAVPNDLEWMGLPVHGAAGLELGLIKEI